MARPCKIVQLQLERECLRARNAGRTAIETADALNDTLRRRESKETVSRTAVERYWATLDEASVAPAHQPQVAQRNARTAGDVGERTLSALAELEELWEDAKAERFENGARNWTAILGVARERRETLKAYVELAERIHNLETIQAFQRIVYDTIARADPDVQREVKRAFESQREIIRARLLTPGGPSEAP